MKDCLQAKELAAQGALVQTNAPSHKFEHDELIKGFQRRKFATVMLFFEAIVSHVSPDTICENRLQLETMSGIGVAAPGTPTQAE